MIRVHKRRMFQVQPVQLVNKHCQEFNQTNRTKVRAPQKGECKNT